MNVPIEMHDTVKKLISEHPDLGYKSVADFCTSAGREKLLELKKLIHQVNSD